MGARAFAARKCRDILPGVAAHSSSGLGHRPLKAEITGSNPVCATSMEPTPLSAWAFLCARIGGQGGVWRGQGEVKREEFEQMYAAEDRLWWYLGLRENALALLELDGGAGAGAR